MAIWRKCPEANLKKINNLQAARFIERIRRSVSDHEELRAENWHALHRTNFVMGLTQTVGAPRKQKKGIPYLQVSLFKLRSLKI